jgi:hypothetical protein
MKPELVANYIALGSVVIALLSLIVAVVSASAARKSANAAQSSVEVASRVLRRSVIRDLWMTCADVVSEERRVRDVSHDLQAAYSDLFLFGGSSGGDRDQLYRQEIDRDRREAARLSDEATSIFSEPISIQRASDHDLDVMCLKIENARIAIRAIREKMSRQFESVRLQTLQYREKNTG